MTPSDIFVFIQTTARRDPVKTLESVEASDIGNKYNLMIDVAPREFPRDNQALQDWWLQNMQYMAETARDLGYKLILRLEDDVIVNKHILHNIASWDALNELSFGMGTLFYPNYWDKAAYIFAKTARGNLFRQTPDVEGAQGQVFKPEDLLSMLPLTQSARELKGLGKPQHPPSFDWSLSRAAYMRGGRTFVHTPSLVDLNNDSLTSQLSSKEQKQDPANHYWGSNHFDPDWRSSANLSASLSGSLSEV